MVQQGQSLAIPVTLTRRTSSGVIRLAASGLPPGTSVAPVESTLATASPLASSTTLTLQLSAQTTAPPASDTSITISAEPLARTAGVGTRSQPVVVRVQVLHDLRVTGIEVTQGIQQDLFSLPMPSAPQTARYAGVPLQDPSPPAWARVPSARGCPSARVPVRSRCAWRSPRTDVHA